MDFGKTVDSTMKYFQGHPLMGAGAVLALIVLIYLKPKAVFKLAAAAMILVAVLYVGSFLIDLTNTGIHEQDKSLSDPHLKQQDL
ncbi:MAG TPA: hypothetical protein VEI74_14360 [Candidatus Methylomirabilis sp.]|nr:hypothetical protein [Candidatus Methylomirabilis sp.]